jgi:subtilisin family serine protease
LADLKREDTADDFYKYGKVKEFARGIGRGRPEKPADQIRVAILDTGVDVTHDDLQSPWIDGQIFYQNFAGVRSGIPQDNDGHGACVTSILLQMAENVDLYVARVSPDGLNWKTSDVVDVRRRSCVY